MQKFIDGLYVKTNKNDAADAEVIWQGDVPSDHTLHDDQEHDATAPAMPDL